MLLDYINKLSMTCTGCNSLGWNFEYFLWRSKNPPEPSDFIHSASRTVYMQLSFKGIYYLHVNSTTLNSRYSYHLTLKVWYILSLVEGLCNIIKNTLKQGQIKTLWRPPWTFCCIGQYFRCQEFRPFMQL